MGREYSEEEWAMEWFCHRKPPTVPATLPSFCTVTFVFSPFFLHNFHCILSTCPLCYRKGRKDNPWSSKNNNCLFPSPAPPSPHLCANWGGRKFVLSLTEVKRNRAKKAVSLSPKSAMQHEGGRKVSIEAHTLLCILMRSTLLC